MHCSTLYTNCAPSVVAVKHVGCEMNDRRKYKEKSVHSGLKKNYQMKPRQKSAGPALHPPGPGTWEDTWLSSRDSASLSLQGEHMMSVSQAQV